jgi:hypothetical protein
MPQTKLGLMSMMRTLSPLEAKVNPLNAKDVEKGEGLGCSERRFGKGSPGNGEGERQ